MAVRLSLTPHPETPPGAVTGVEVSLERPSIGRLRLTYAVFGEMDDVILPAPAAPLRTDRLWEATCFEAFVRAKEDPSYRELNFSPSGQWAAYFLRDYRDLEPLDLPLPAAPEILIRARRADRLELRVDLSIDLAPEPARLNLAAVIEERGSIMSYWALAHPSHVPDFHHRDCFVLDLPPAEQP